MDKAPIGALIVLKIGCFGVSSTFSVALRRAVVGLRMERGSGVGVYFGVVMRMYECAKYALLDGVACPFLIRRAA